jgi:glycine/D-amino acid oxidase-like deaminating enzyme
LQDHYRKHSKLYLLNRVIHLGVKQAPEIPKVSRPKTLNSMLQSSLTVVLHAGIYYPPSLKAELCVKSLDMMDHYLTSRYIPFNKCGKLIVSTTEDELPYLDKIFKQAHHNGAKDVIYISQDEAKALEPEVSCIRALWSPRTAIFDSHMYMLNLIKDMEDNGAFILYKCDVHRISPSLDSSSRFTVKTSQGDIGCDFFINSCGLQAQYLTRTGQTELLSPKEPRISIADRCPPAYFLKGNYFKYTGMSKFVMLIVSPQYAAQVGGNPSPI